MKKVISISIEDEILKKADILVKNNINYISRSHLIATLILKESRKTKKEKANVN